MGFEHRYKEFTGSKLKRTSLSLLSLPEHNIALKELGSCEWTAILSSGELTVILSSVVLKWD